MGHVCKEIIEVAEGPTVCVDEMAHKEHRASSVFQEVGYGIKVWVERPYDEVLESVKQSLSAQGFTILSEIDVHKMLSEKHKGQFPKYSVYSVCIPELVHRALERDKDMGLLLQHSVIVYEHADGSVVEAIDPIAQFSIADGHTLRDIALETKRKLQDAVNHVAAGVV